MKKIFLIVLLILILGPFSTNAQGLVPCGGEGQPPCQFCHLFVLLDNIVRFILFTLVPPIAVLMTVIGGIMFFAATGDPNKVDKAKSVLTTVVIGLVIVYGAWVLINSFFLVIGVAEWTGLRQGWFAIDCPT